MNWLGFVAVAVILDALRIFIDNYVSDVYFKGREAVSQKWFYAFIYVIVGTVILAASGFNLNNLDWAAAGLFVFSGFLASFSGIPYYKALEIEDTTNLGIFIQLAPIFYLILGWFFLGETFSPVQLVAFLVILAAPLLIIATTRKRSRKVKIRAVLYAFLYVFVAVIANVIFVKADNENFTLLNEVALLFLGKGLGNFIIMLARPKWRKRFNSIYKSSRGKVLRPLIANSAIGLVKDFAYRGALITAPAVALASVSSDSAEPIVIFFMGLVLTLIWPKFGREKLNRKTVLVHLIATVLVVAGIVLLQTA